MDQKSFGTTIQTKNLDLFKSQRRKYRHQNQPNYIGTLYKEDDICD